MSKTFRNSFLPFPATIAFTPDRAIIEEGEDIVYSIELSTEIKHYDLNIGTSRINIIQLPSNISDAHSSFVTYIVNDTYDMETLLRTMQ